MKKESRRIEDLKKGVPFIWGEVIAFHKIGEYDIVEYHPWKRDGIVVKTNSPDYNKKSYHGWIGERDTSHSWETLDAAIVGCIAYKHEGPNHKADFYFIRMLRN